MCAQGVNWYSAQPYTTTAKNNSETFVFGCQNDTIAGEKTEIVSPLWLVGVLGLKAEVVVGAQIGWVEGYKYDRVPLGQVEVVGDHVGSHGSHTTSVGTSFFVNAETSAKISSQNLILTSTAPVPEQLSAANAALQTTQLNVNYRIAVNAGQNPAPVVPVQPIPATTNISTLSLLPTQVSLIAGQNTTTNTSPASLFLTQTGATLTGTTATNLVSILAAALIINHATSVSLGTPDNNLTANDLGVTIVGAPAVILNTDNFQCNSEVAEIGQPPVVPPTYADLLTAAETAATAAAGAAAAALAASYP